MFKKEFKVIGHPNLRVNSLNKEYNHGANFSLLESQLTTEVNKEIEELKAMGLIREIKKTAIGRAITNLFSRDNTEVNEIRSTVQNNHSDLVSLIRDMEKRLSAKIDNQVITPNPMAGFPLPKQDTSPNKIVPIRKEEVIDEEELNNSVIYISPDKKDLTASKEVESSASTDNLDDAVNKLRGRKGTKKNG